VTTPMTSRTTDTLDGAPSRPMPPPGRAWAVAGALAGLGGVVGIYASLQIDAVYNKDYAGDADRIADRLGDFVPEILVLHFAMMAASVLLLVFAAGLRRRLAGRLPSDSLLPNVAAAGLVVTSVVALLGVGFTTEIVFGLTDDEVALDPEFAAVVGHWMGTIPWLWVGTGVSGVCIALASFRHGALPRWIGLGAAGLGGLTLLAGLSPLQYMAGFFGPVLVLLLGVAFAFGDRDATRLVSR